MARHQPVTTAAMEALFHSGAGAPMVILGQPDVEHQRIDNPIVVNKALSFLIYGTTAAEVKGLDQFPEETWPTNIPLALLRLPRDGRAGDAVRGDHGGLRLPALAGRLFRTQWMLWVLMLAAPFPYIANTAGWITAEVGRQPWLVYGLLRTAERIFSERVGGQRTVHTAWIHGALRTALGVLPVPAAAADRARPARWAGQSRIPVGLGRRGLTMETLWFILVALMLVGYVVLDGFDLGAGALHLVVARTDEERRAVLARHRTGLGRQRSVAAGRRRHAVLCVSAALRLELQRVLPGIEHRVVAAGVRGQWGSNSAHTCRTRCGATSSTARSRSRASC